MKLFSALKGRLRKESVQAPAPASRHLRCGTPILQHAEACGKSIRVERDEDDNIIVHIDEPATALGCCNRLNDTDPQTDRPWHGA